jgi:dipeptidyl aminopeptidase/acylaminoacyl peptidase
VSSEDVVKFNFPFLIIHSEIDKVVPYNQYIKAQKIFKGIKNIEFWSVNNSEHVRIIYNHTKEYEKKLKAISTKGEK